MRVTEYTAVHEPMLSAGPACGEPLEELPFHDYTTGDQLAGTGAPLAPTPASEKDVELLARGSPISVDGSHSPPPPSPPMSDAETAVGVAASCCWGQELNPHQPCPVRRERG